MGAGASAKYKDKNGDARIEELTDTIALLQENVNSINEKLALMEAPSTPTTREAAAPSKEAPVLGGEAPRRKPSCVEIGGGGLRRLGSMRLAAKDPLNYREHPPSAVIRGAEAWTSGRFLVLSGEASVITKSTSGQDVILARLRKDNEFGWEHAELGHNDPSRLDPHLWENLEARIVVGPSPLKLMSLSDDAASVEYGKRHLASLWLTSSPPANGIAYAPIGSIRAHFLAELWAPLIDRLEGFEDEIRRRRRRGFRADDCFPLQGSQIAELRCSVMHLTEIWYGTAKGGNVSALYRWFMKAMEAVGVTKYSFDAIPLAKSSDGWGVIIDGSARAAALKGGGTGVNHEETGGFKQKQGRSAIDNTVLVNVFTAAEARMMLLGRRVRKAICKFMSLRQRVILHKLSDQLQLDLFSRALDTTSAKDHRVVRSVLRSLSSEDLRACNVDADGICFRSLVSRGCVMAGFGQLEPTDQTKLWEHALALILPGVHAKDDVGPKHDSEDIFDRLVLWCREKPGEYFEKNKLRHAEVMIAGMWANKVVLVKRSAMERMTLARYFAVSWRRSQPLWALFGSSGPAQLRTHGTWEASRVRANECPYMRMHGMSLASGGFAHDQRRSGEKVKGYSLMMELQWVQDPAANIENWFITDIEKILQEAWHLNPHGDKSVMLPGEMFVNVGQNPKIGSSIKQTQHTQLCEGSLSSYPVLQLSSPEGPVHSERLDCFLDFVDVVPTDASPESKGFFLKVIAARPVSPVIVQFLVELRLHLLASFGGAEGIDFLVTAVSNESGGFVVLFAAIPHLVKVGSEPPDLATWANPLTGESSESSGLHEARLDFGKGVGHFLCMKPALKAQVIANGEDFMRRVWAFNRVPGIPEAIRKFARDKFVVQ